jgi:hypothetical protein
MDHPKHPWETNHVLVRRDDILETASMAQSVHQRVFLLFFDVRINIGMKVMVIVGLGLRLRSARHTSA